MNLIEKWNNLPQEIKVLGYITLSALIAELIKILSGLHFDSVWVAGLVNVVLVVLREAQKRRTK